jgi:hypothetical protein
MNLGATGVMASRAREPWAGATGFTHSINVNVKALLEGSTTAFNTVLAALEVRTTCRCLPCIVATVLALT